MKLKVGDLVKVKKALIEQHLIGKIVKIRKIEDGKLWVEGGDYPWREVDDYLKCFELVKEKENLKFKVGDVVVGNKKANCYVVTKEGYTGTVTESTEDRFSIDGFLANPDCFDLVGRVHQKKTLGDTHKGPWLEEDGWMPPLCPVAPGIFNPWDSSPSQYKDSKKKGVIPMLSILAKKLLDADVKALVEIGWLDSELDVTESGTDAILALFVEQNKAELAKRAKEELKKRKDK